MEEASPVHRQLPIEHISISHISRLEKVGLYGGLNDRVIRTLKQVGIDVAGDLLDEPITELAQFSCVNHRKLRSWKRVIGVKFSITNFQNTNLSHNAFWKTGFQTMEDIQEASEDELLDVPGTTVEDIRKIQRVLNPEITAVYRDID